MKVDFDNVALRNDLHARHLSLGQHLVDKVVPRDVSPAGVDGVQQAHDQRYDEQGPQALPIHLVLLLATFLLLWNGRTIKEMNKGHSWESFNQLGTSLLTFVFLRSFSLCSITFIFLLIGSRCAEEVY